MSSCCRLETSWASGRAVFSYPGGGNGKQRDMAPPPRAPDHRPPPPPGRPQAQAVPPPVVQAPPHSCRARGDHRHALRPLIPRRRNRGDLGPELASARGGSEDPIQSGPPRGESNRGGRKRLSGRDLPPLSFLVFVCSAAAVSRRSRVEGGGRKLEEEDWGWGTPPGGGEEEGNGGGNRREDTGVGHI